jgi:hypothetical protein
MLAMDQFKDIRGYTNYASRLTVGFGRALVVWWIVAWDESIGYLLGKNWGPTRVRVEACDPDLQKRWLGASSD